jgi:GTP-binding protein LepA
VGFVICGIKNLKEVQVGDTITTNKLSAEEPLPGFKKVKPMVFSGIFPVESPDYKELQEALEKLCLNDSSLSFEVESSAALGFGFRCGFLGLLHMEIVQERLEREFDLDLITTAPTVVHHVYRTNGEMQVVENPSQLVMDSSVERIEEPYVRLSLHTPSDCVGALLKLCEERRGIQEKMEYIASEKVVITYKLPLSEMVFDFYDKLKSVSKGYASMEYELIGYEQSDLVKMDVMINGDPVDALSVIVHRAKSQSRGRVLAKKLKEIIPRQQYQVAIQAAIGSNIIARETLGALRKDVTAKCYGGDITRKRKLLEKQKEGKKRMKQIGRIEIPQKAFLAVLKTDD